MKSTTLGKAKLFQHLKHWPAQPEYASAGMAAAAGVASTISSKLDTPDDEDVEAIVEDETLSEKDKTNKIYKLFFAASSDGDLDTVRDILGGKAEDFIDIDGTDDSGSTALIYASCFGHEDIVVELLRYGADVDKPDQSEWTPLMWAVNDQSPGCRRAVAREWCVSHKENVYRKVRAGFCHSVQWDLHIHGITRVHKLEPA